MRKLICMFLIVLHLLVISHSTLVIAAEVYALAPGDILEVKIIGQAKFDTKQSIAPDGKMNLPLLGRVAVSGYTMDKLTEYLNEEFSLYLVKPQVIIYLTPRPIYIIQHDVKKNTWEVKEAKSIEEARALAGKDYTGDINYGDIITVDISKEPDFWEENWYKIITATAVLAGIYSTLK